MLGDTSLCQSLAGRVITKLDTRTAVRHKGFSVGVKVHWEEQARDYSVSCCWASTTKIGLGREEVVSTLTQLPCVFVDKAD